jgi:hypothetical protein
VLGNNRLLRVLFFSLGKAFHKSTDFNAESLKNVPNPMFQDLSSKFAKPIQKK